MKRRTSSFIFFFLPFCQGVRGVDGTSVVSGSSPGGTPSTRTTFTATKKKGRRRVPLIFLFTFFFFLLTQKKYLINIIYFALPLCRWRQSLEEHGGNPKSTWKRGEKDKSKVLVTHSQVGTYNRDRGKSAVHGGSDRSKVRLSLVSSCLSLSFFYMHCKLANTPFLLSSLSIVIICGISVKNKWPGSFFHPLFLFLVVSCLSTFSNSTCVLKRGSCRALLFFSHLFCLNGTKIF